MAEPVETISYKGYTIKVFVDEDPVDPRKEFTNYSRIICFHKRYEIGDISTEKFGNDPEVFKKWIIRQTQLGLMVSIPVYMMDHSGLTLSTSPALFQACDPQGFDWGLLGYAYMTNEMIKECLGTKRISAKQKMKAYEIIKQEIELLNDYISGNVYGYEIVKEGDPEDETYNRDVINSCWGFYGDPNTFMVLEAKNFIDSLEGEKDE